MRPDVGAREGVGLSLLDFEISKEEGKVWVTFKRSFDYFLLMAFYLVLATPFMLLAVGLISQIADGPVIKSLFSGLMFFFLMVGVVGLLSHFLMYLRDGFRRVCFDPTNGHIILDQGGFDHVLSRYTTLLFADVAGIRINHFGYRSGLRHKSGYEILLVFQDGNDLVLLPLVNSYDEAVAKAKQLSASTGLPAINC